MLNIQWYLLLNDDEVFENQKLVSTCIYIYQMLSNVSASSYEHSHTLQFFPMSTKRNKQQTCLHCSMFE